MPYLAGPRIGSIPMTVASPKCKKTTLKTSLIVAIHREIRCRSASRAWAACRGGKFVLEQVHQASDAVPTRDGGLVTSSLVARIHCAGSGSRFQCLQSFLLRSLFCWLGLDMDFRMRRDDCDLFHSSLGVAHRCIKRSCGYSWHSALRPPSPADSAELDHFIVEWLFPPLSVQPPR